MQHEREYRKVLELRHDRFVTLICALAITCTTLVTEADIFRRDQSFAELTLAASLERFEVAAYILESTFGYECMITVDDNARFGDRKKLVALEVVRPTTSRYGAPGVVS